MTRNAFWGLCIGLCLTGTQAIAQKMESKSIKTTDKTDSISFHIDGITEGETLFTVIGGPEAPVINAGMPGTEGIQGGFEGGSIVKINGVYHMFPTERAGVKGMPAYHDRVKTRIGHWTSTDAVHWTRQSTILESSGVYALVHEDNPMNDRRSAICLICLYSAKKTTDGTDSIWLTPQIKKLHPIILSAASGDVNPKRKV